MNVIDVRGDICPVPLLKCVKEIKKMKKGEILVVISDHPPAKRSIPIEMTEQGNKFKIYEKGPEFKIEIVVS